MCAASVAPSRTDDKTTHLIPQQIADELASPAAHADDRIFKNFKWLRENEPLGWATPKGFDPYWVVTRQKDLRTIAMDADTFHNGDRSVVMDSLASQARMKEILGDRSWPLRIILNMDPPEHQKYRAVTAEFFHARSLDGLTETIRGIAREFVDELIATGGTCDFATQTAFTYPLHVILSVLGVPRSDEPQILKLTQEFFGVADEDLSRDGSVAAGADYGDVLMKVTEDFNAFFDPLLEARRKNPQSDMITVIANSTIDGAPMPVLEARSYCMVAATAGHDTTSAVTAGAMQALCENPDIFRELKEDPSKINAFIEEATRVATPSKITMRTATRDVHVCDRDFQKGDWIAMAWASGNFDDEVVPEPDKFRIDRKPNKLISYGNGPHVCLGQHLARLEMRLLFQEIISRIDHVELAGEPKRMASLMVSGLKTLPIRFKAS